MNPKKIVASATISILLLSNLVASAKAPTPYTPINRDEFTIIEMPSNRPIIEPKVLKSVPKRPKSRVEAKPKYVVKSVVKAPTPTRHIPATSHSVYGVASWYCKAGVSACHYKYPAGSMVAAACGKLRAAMGSSWRGKTVTVKHSTRVVRVKLVDWCGSKDKLIDLYWEPMRRLGGTGTLHVKVTW